MAILVKPTVAGGFPEYLPEYQIEFERIKVIIAETYARHGFTPLDTPDLEKTEVLLAKGGGETDKQVYQIDKKPLSMRFDLTVPLARYAAEHQAELTFPFKRFHIGKVHRGERNQAGRFHEFYQCDIDTIGTTSPLADAEFPAVINEIFTRLNFGKFVIRINDRRVINGFFDLIGIADESKPEALHTLDKIEKMPKANFIKELAVVGLNETQINKIIEFTEISGESSKVIRALESIGGGRENEIFDAGIASIRIVAEAVRALGVPEENFKIDTKITRGLDYYTGTVYETFLVDYPELGSVCSGGRFDNLTENYTETKLPGVGISIGLSRLFYALKENGTIKPGQKSPAKVVVFAMTEKEFAYAAEVAKVLREAGVSTMLYTESGKMKKKLSYADKMGFSYALVIGESEVAGRTVSVKNMALSEKEVIGIDEIVDKIIA